MQEYSFCFYWYLNYFIGEITLYIIYSHNFVYWDLWKTIIYYHLVNILCMMRRNSCWVLSYVKPDSYLICQTFLCLYDRFNGNNYSVVCHLHQRPVLYSISPGNLIMFLHIAWIINLTVPPWLTFYYPHPSFSSVAGYLCKTS